MQVMLVEPTAERAVRAVEQQIHQTGNHRRHGKRNVQQRQQQLASGEVKARHQPGQQNAEHQVHRHGNQRNHHRQPDGVQHVRIGQIL